MLVPGRPVPKLAVPLAGGGAFELSEEKPDHFTLVVFYRGLHCPICQEILSDLESRIETFSKMGVGAIAISADAEPEASRSRGEWKIEKLRIGYGLDEKTARAWGLFVSSAALPQEPERFFEPALFLVRPNGTLYGSSVNSMPFARASLADLETALPVIIQTQHPPRGVA